MSRLRDKFRKYLSDGEKLKKTNSMRGSLVKFLNKPNIVSDYFDVITKCNECKGVQEYECQEIVHIPTINNNIQENSVDDPLPESNTICYYSEDIEDPGNRIKSHKFKKDHLKTMQRWMDLSLNLENGNTLDHHIQNQILTKKDRWRTVLKRITACIPYLTRQNDTFRRKHCTIYNDQNGKFLKLIEMIASFDNLMENYVALKIFLTGYRENGYENTKRNLNISEMDEDDLMKHYMDIKILLEVGDTKDINGRQLAPSPICACGSYLFISIYAADNNDILSPTVLLRSGPRK
ncbi:Hypothetical protein CINCED_3A019002 [Cinara cedri]|uniref:Uncharacterized protein n=1 Tax=Cinara cedri TaxID=506608 RepID=A0A5E4NFQ7_9HEMI|nr:Hypothetical protein CINCED_3A019002 [Cinara cedri]